MSECHASKCHEPATTALRIGNNYSFRERPAGPFFYCDEHVEKVGGTMHDRGLRVYLEPMDRSYDPLTSKMIHEVFGNGKASEGMGDGIGVECGQCGGAVYMEPCPLHEWATAGECQTCGLRSLHPCPDCEGRATDESER